MSTTELFTKHFGNVASVDMKHPNIENFFEDLNAECIAEDKQKNCNIQCVTNRYLFFYEDEGEDGYHFLIEAKDHEEAFGKAYESYGPEVNGMMYKLIS